MPRSSIATTTSNSSSRREPREPVRTRHGMRTSTGQPPTEPFTGGTWARWPRPALRLRAARAELSSTTPLLREPWRALLRYTSRLKATRSVLPPAGREAVQFRPRNLHYNSQTQIGLTYGYERLVLRYDEYSGNDQKAV